MKPFYDSKAYHDSKHNDSKAEPYTSFNRHNYHHLNKSGERSKYRKTFQ